MLSNISCPLSPHVILFQSLRSFTLVGILSNMNVVLNRGGYIPTCKLLISCFFFKLLLYLCINASAALCAQ